MRKKLLVVILTIGVFLCSEIGFTQTKIKVTDMLWIPSRVEGFNQGLKKFAEKYPDIKVEYTKLSWETYREWLITSFVGGSMPDVYLTESETCRDLAAMGASLNLSEAGYWTEDLASKFLSLAVEAGKYKGGQYGYPKVVPCPILFYNKDLLREAGVIETPKNWDELVEVSKKITKDIDGDGEIDRWGFELTLTDEDVSLWWVQFQYQAGCDVMEEIAPDEYRMCIDTPESRRATQFMVDLIHKYKVMSPTCVGQSFEDYLARAYSGKWAMTFTGSWVVGWLKGKWPGEVLRKFGAGMIPVGPAKAAVMIDNQTYSIAADSKHKREAWTFIQYFTSREYLLPAECFSTNVLPARIDYWDDPGFNTLPEIFRECLTVARKEMREGWARVYPMVPQFGQIQQDFIIPMIEATLLGKRSVQEAHDFIQNQGNRILTR